MLLLISSIGCSGDSQEKGVGRPEWEPAAVELSPVPEFRLKGTGEPTALPPPPFDASDLAAELSELSSKAASEVAKLKAEAEIEASFPDEAITMLEDVAETLKSVADKGYEPLEIKIDESYTSFTSRVGELEDTIKLGESMAYTLSRDVVSYYQLNSTKLNELKKAYWEEKLDRLREELAAERCRFRFAKEAKLLTQAAEVGANQRAVISGLEKEFRELALGYTARVKDAITEAAQSAGLPITLNELPGSEFASRYEKFDAEFQKHFEKAKFITGVK